MHDLSGHCADCLAIMNKYPGFNQNLWVWFQSVQKENPEAHISCAGRGKIDQEMLFKRGATKAHFGESAHNFNCALDIFELRNGKYTLDKNWFRLVIGSKLRPQFLWYGLPGAKFFELPHIELALWKDLERRTLVKLVEP